MNFIKSLTGGNPYIGIIALLVLLGLLSTDIYLPSLPAITEYYHTSAAITVLSLSYYFITLAVAFLFVGDLVDRYGRRPMLIIGLLVYIVSSLLATLSPTIYALIGARIIQGFGACIINVSARTIARDTSDKNSMSRIFAFIGMVISVSPMIAPLIGGFVEKHLFWQVNFIFLAAFASVLLYFIYHRLPETAPKKNHWEISTEKSFSGEIKAYRAILFHPAFIFYGMILIGFFAFIGSYIGASSFLYHGLGVEPEEFGIIFMITALMFLAGATTNNLMSDWLGSFTILSIGIVITSLGVFGMTYLALSGYHAVWAVMLPMMVATYGNALSIGNVFSNSMIYFRLRAGTATSLQGFLQYGAMAFAVSYVGERFGHAVTAWDLSRAFIVSLLIIWLGYVGAVYIRIRKWQLKYH